MHLRIPCAGMRGVHRPNDAGLYFRTVLTDQAVGNCASMCAYASAIHLVRSVLMRVRLFLALYCVIRLLIRNDRRNRLRY